MIRLDDLEGRWLLSRVIDDARAGVTGRLVGEAEWRAGANGLIQEEQGTLHYGAAAPMQASRRYLWRQTGSCVEVLFEDGRHFHIVPDPGAEAVHLCDPDLYRVTYDFFLPQAFTQTWRVTGPRKDARITSKFRRA